MSVGLRSVGPGSAGSGSPCLKLPGEVQGSSRAKPGPVARWRGLAIPPPPARSCVGLQVCVGLLMGREPRSPGRVLGDLTQCANSVEDVSVR